MNSKETMKREPNGLTKILLTTFINICLYCGFLCIYQIALLSISLSVTSRAHFPG